MLLLLPLLPLLLLRREDRSSLWVHARPVGLLLLLLLLMQQQLLPLLLPLPLLPLLLLLLLLRLDDRPSLRVRARPAGLLLLLRDDRPSLRVRARPAGLLRLLLCRSPSWVRARTANPLLLRVLLFSSCAIRLPPLGLSSRSLRVPMGSLIRDARSIMPPRQEERGAACTSACDRTARHQRPSPPACLRSSQWATHTVGQKRRPWRTSKSGVGDARPSFLVAIA
jgi:hypothetical protein